MPIDVACRCGFRTTVPDAYAGKRGKCKKCRQPIAIPAAVPVAAYALPDPDPDREPPSGFVAPIVDTSEDEEEERTTFPAAPLIGPEPWYYHFLVVYAYLIIGLGTALGLGWVGRDRKPGETGGVLVFILHPPMERGGVE